MNCKILSIFVVVPLLFACNKNSVPQKGYNKWKDDIKTKQPTGKYEYKQCNYAYIKKVPSYPSLNETCYYYSLFSLNGVSYYSYYMYENATDTLDYDMNKQQGEGYTYRLAVQVIQQDPSIGELGTL